MAGIDFSVFKSKCSSQSTVYPSVHFDLPDILFFYLTITFGAVTNTVHFKKQAVFFL